MAIPASFKLDRIRFDRGYNWDFSVQISENGSIVDPTGWSAELEIRDKSNQQIVRIQTSPAPPGSPASTGQGSITVDSSNKWFLCSFSATAESVAEGSYFIEAKAWDTSGNPWPLIPLRLCEIGRTIMRGI